jgi:hypothetical protein
MQDGQVESSEDEAYLSWLRSPDGGRMVRVRDLGDGRYTGISPLLFHWTLKVGTIGDYFGYDDRWCYETEGMAKAALEAWDGVGEPTGWHRHPYSGRRRPHGDPKLEYFER